MKTIINGTEVEIIGIQESEYLTLKSQIQVLNGQIQVLTTQSTADKAEIARLQVLVTSLEAEIVRLKATTPPVSTDEVLFHGKFDGASLSNDTIVPWVTGMENLAICRDLYLNSSAKAPATIVDDLGRKVMKAALVTTPLSGDRVQLGVVFEENMSLSVYHCSQQIYLHPDLAYLSQFSGIMGGSNWLVLFETWMSRVAEWAGDPPSRVNLGIKKNSGAGQPLKWELRNQYIQPSSIAYTNILPVQESGEPIPFGRWFTLDVKIVTGEGTSGRTTIKIDDKVIFDIVGTTTYPGRPEIKRGTINPIKFYANDTIVNFIKTAGKKFEALYGDFKFFKS